MSPEAGSASLGASAWINSRTMQRELSSRDTAVRTKPLMRVVAVAIAPSRPTQLAAVERGSAIVILSTVLVERSWEFVTILQKASAG